MRLPDGLLTLRKLDVASCKLLAEDWLPANSAGRLHTLNVARSNMRLVPAGTSELRVLSIAWSDCQESSIPPGVLCSLQKLNGLPI